MEVCETVVKTLKVCPKILVILFYLCTFMSYPKCDIHVLELT